MILYKNNEGYSAMNSNNHFNDVKEFMAVFGQELLESPKLPSSKIGLLRYNLIEEEADELAEALIDDDIVEVADALADLLYVIYGAYASMGIIPTLDEFESASEPALTKDLRIPNITESITMNQNMQSCLRKMMKGYETGELIYIQDALDSMLDNVHHFSFLCGIDIFECFDEVHRSNLSKTCSSEEEAVESINMRLHDEGNEDYRDAWISQVGSYFIINRGSDGKALKGKNFFEPNLKDILGV